MRHAWIRGVGVVGLAGVLASGCSNPERDKVRHLERGNEYASEKRDEFALVEYLSAVKIDPQYGEAHLKLAETYQRMGNLRDAFPSYVRAADSMPDNRDVQLKATQVLLLSGRFDDARARAASLLAKNPDDVDALLLRANALVALRDPEGAIKEIEDALRVNPRSSQAFVALGAVRMNSGEAKEAEAAFRRAVALEPASVDPMLALANFLWAADRASEAEAVLKDALAREPKHLLANRAWQLADEFKRRVYRIIRDHPEASADLRFRDQLRTSAASVAMNMAEGFYRFTGRDFARHLGIALASLGEAVLWLRDGVDRGYFQPHHCEEAFTLANRCRAATLKFRSSLIASIERREQAKQPPPRRPGPRT